MGGQNYEIKVEGMLDPTWRDWFEEMDLRHEPDGKTVLRGHLKDQSALHGVLNRLLNLNLKLISVTCCGQQDDLPEDAESERREDR